MKRFTFSLDRLLRLRHQETEQSKLQLARSVRFQAEADEHLRQATVVLGEQTSRAAHVGVFTAGDFVQQRRHVQLLQRNADEAESAVAEAAEALAASRRQLVEQRQKEEILTKLRERRYELYKANSAREEQDTLDEISLAGQQPLRRIDSREGDA